MLASRLTKLREEKMLTQAELARKTGVTRQALNAIEKGKQEPSMDLARRIAQVLETSISDIFVETEKTTNKDQRNRGLSKLERLKLANQYKILHDLNRDSDMAEHYGYLEEIFRRGYIHLYWEAFDNIIDEMPESASREVLQILEMHSAMLFSLGTKPDPEYLERVKFRGFDANNEADYLAFARFYCNEGERYRELKIFNSHYPTLDRYANMLREWKRLGGQHQLSKDEIEKILVAGTY